MLVNKSPNYSMRELTSVSQPSLMFKESFTLKIFSKLKHL